MIMAAVLIAKNPSQYGFEIGPVEPLAFDKVTVPDALRLDVVAEWLNVPVEQMQRLNPELRRGMTPLGKHAHDRARGVSVFEQSARVGVGLHVTRRE